MNCKSYSLRNATAEQPQHTEIESCNNESNKGRNTLRKPEERGENKSCGKHHERHYITQHDGHNARRAVRSHHNNLSHFIVFGFVRRNNNLALLARPYSARLTRGARRTSLTHLDSDTHCTTLRSEDYAFMLYLGLLFHAQRV